MLKNFKQFTMNEEYNLPTERVDQQLMIKEIAKAINPYFIVLFNQHNITITINNRYNQSGKFNNKLDIHKISNCLEEFIELEKELFNSGIITEQLPELVIDYTHIKVSFSIL
jgi:hypothetical protein